MRLPNDITPYPARPANIDEISVLRKQVGKRVHVVTVPGVNNPPYNCGYGLFVYHISLLKQNMPTSAAVSVPAIYCSARNLALASAKRSSTARFSLSLFQSGYREVVSDTRSIQATK